MLFSWQTIFRDTEDDKVKFPNIKFDTELR